MISINSKILEKTLDISKVLGYNIVKLLKQTQKPDVVTVEHILKLSIYYFVHKVNSLTIIHIKEGENMSDFARNVRKFRLERGLTQAELGKKVDVCQVVIQNYEKGKTTPKPENFVRLAKALGTTCEKLVGETVAV